MLKSPGIMFSGAVVISEEFAKSYSSGFMIGVEAFGPLDTRDDEFT